MTDDTQTPGNVPGNVKVTREDWLTVAMDVLVSEGVEQVKVQTLGARLEVSRSSFYWYFKSRQHLLDELLAAWDAKNTGGIIRQTRASADTITRAVCNLFQCFYRIDLFDPQLDFAVREWARRSGPVRRAVDRADEKRLGAIRDMFLCHGYAPDEADIRARILYYQQIGYYTLELQESVEERISRVAAYLYGFTGVHPSPEEVADQARDARAAITERDR